jgi:multiubiquitin
MPDLEKSFEIIVNGQKKSWSKDQISYAEVVDLAFPPPHDPNTIFTVLYTNGPDGHREGTLVEGQSVGVKNHMIFHVKRTNKS